MKKFPNIHKSGCNCGVCKAVRGETKGENSSRFGTHHSEETLVKMRKPRSKEACVNIKAAANRPEVIEKKHTKESNRKRGETQRGVPKPSKLKGRTYVDIYGDGVEEMCIKRKGKNNGMWQGGTSFDVYPEEFFRLVPIIRERDEVCQVCGKHQRRTEKNYPYTILIMIRIIMLLIIWCRFVEVTILELIPIVSIGSGILKCVG